MLFGMSRRLYGSTSSLSPSSVYAPSRMGPPSSAKGDDGGHLLAVQTDTSLPEVHLDSSTISEHEALPLRRTHSELVQGLARNRREECTGIDKRIQVLRFSAVRVANCDGVVEGSHEDRVIERRRRSQVGTMRYHLRRPTRSTAPLADLRRFVSLTTCVDDADGALGDEAFRFGAAGGGSDVVGAGQGAPLRRRPHRQRRWARRGCRRGRFAGRRCGSTATRRPGRLRRRATRRRWIERGGAWRPWA